MDPTDPMSTGSFDEQMHDLAGEMWKELCNVVIPSGQTVLLQAVQSEQEGSQALHFRPPPPVVNKIHSQLQKDALELYYARNTFLVSGNMLSAAILRAFVANRPEAAEIRHIKINHIHHVKSELKKGQHQICEPVFPFTVRLSAKITPEKVVEITDMRVSEPPSLSSANAGLKVGFCCCFVGFLCRLDPDTYTSAGGLLTLIEHYLEYLANKRIMRFCHCITCGRLHLR